VLNDAGERPVRIDPALTRRLFVRAQGERWRVPLDRFAEALAAAADRAFAGKPADTAGIERHLSALHLEDLALACACAAGDEAAWEHFVREYRPALYRAADALDPSGSARELADALYGDLFGTTERDGERRSLLRYFHGRSSLSTWLRAVLAQRFVDRVRARRREEPLPEDESPAALPSSARALDPDRDRAVSMMRDALAGAIAALETRDRLRLGCYYAQELTLAETGRILGEHEATVSRQLARARKDIRADVERRLRDDNGLSDAQVAECFASIVDDAGALDLRDLVGPDGLRKKLPRDRSTVVEAGPSRPGGGRVVRPGGKTP
jgi:RNA polymerase sigma-70 factor (ECF subfamily)